MRQHGCIYIVHNGFGEACIAGNTPNMKLEARSSEPAPSISVQLVQWRRRKHKVLPHVAQRREVVRRNQEIKTRNSWICCVVVETERGSTHAAARALVFFRSSKLIDALRRRSRIVRSNNDHRAYTQSPLKRLIMKAKKS